ncbi:hypothetical protein ILUMI_18297 [Ignelater luminosus]|uniref:Secreted protein n=1 Tax=Ignelater luminosus TaxID=2038154 RepID=A0A8K0CMT8_IGNLU|nr:hypothetical protein ILUMI_18297 [Ignelater luminosus]
MQTSRIFIFKVLSLFVVDHLIIFINSDEQISNNQEDGSTLKQSLEDVATDIKEILDVKKHREEKQANDTQVAHSPIFY